MVSYVHISSWLMQVSWVHVDYELWLDLDLDLVNKVL